ncbi:MAG: hypothetical protein ACYCW6_28070 [Candidatus Xenobia bacterium]
MLGLALGLLEQAFRLHARIVDQLADFLLAFSDQFPGLSVQFIFAHGDLLIATRITLVVPTVCVA